MKIAIDFDGTCVTHKFPEVGEDVGAVQVLKKLVMAGHKLILYTMRSNGQTFPHVLDDAINWFKENDIELYSIQKDVGQENWTLSPKCYADLYIDDAALGCPLIHVKDARPYVDWNAIEFLLIQKGFLYNV